MTMGGSSRLNIHIKGDARFARALQSLLNDHDIADSLGNAISKYDNFIILPPEVVALSDLDGLTDSVGEEAASWSDAPGCILLTDGKDLSVRLPEGMICSLVSLNDPVDVLIAGIRAAASGEPYCSPSLHISLSANVFAKGDEDTP